MCGGGHSVKRLIFVYVCEGFSYLCVFVKIECVFVFGLMYLGMVAMGKLASARLWAHVSWTVAFSPPKPSDREIGPTGHESIKISYF